MTKSEVVSLLMNSQYYKQGYKQGVSDILDKIRAEIESKEMVETTSEHEFYNMALNEVLQIIDKYKAEGSNKE